MHDFGLWKNMQTPQRNQTQGQTRNLPCGSASNCGNLIILITHLAIITAVYFLCVHLIAKKVILNWSCIWDFCKSFKSWITNGYPFTVCILRTEEVPLTFAWINCFCKDSKNPNLLFNKISLCKQLFAQLNFYIFLEILNVYLIFCNELNSIKKCDETTRVLSECLHVHSL